MLHTPSVLFRALAAITLLLVPNGGGAAVRAEALPSIPRVLPPDGVKLDEAVRQKLSADLAERMKQFEKFKESLSKRPLERPAGDATGGKENPLVADVQVLLKAVDLAIKYNEFYSDKDPAKAFELLSLAQARMNEALTASGAKWPSQTGLVVRGYRSSIDGSPQPYGLVIPANHDFTKPVPLYLFLHGRGEKQTDLHFVHERLHNPGQIAPAGAIVLHPFGRQCIGWKSAGEVDCLEAIADVERKYKIDPRRIVLMGFSMGGAGVWHIGAHYTDRFCAMSPGAGFSETAQFMRWKPAEYGPWYEQKLWGLYDVPCYTRNLFNIPVVAYSGEKDGQIQAARVMEAAFQAEGQTLTHVIGPNTQHSYHPEALKQVLAQLAAAAQKGVNPAPPKVMLQTRTLSYGSAYWVQATGLVEHWSDSRIEAQLTGPAAVSLTTKNITSLDIRPPFPSLPAENATLTVDGQSISLPAEKSGLYRLLAEGSGENRKWRLAAPPAGLHKSPGRQGPIDDAFMERFLVVRPTGKSQHPAVQQWVDAELAHFLDRWRSVFRGEPPVKNDSEVTADDIRDCHLILWGDPGSNSVLAKALPKLPLEWTAQTLRVGTASFPAGTHVPLMIYPNPLALGQYVVLNSGPTFRETHDRNNSLQNPHLPDWALVDVTTPPDASWPGKIAAADFFDEAWQLKSQVEKK